MHAIAASSPLHGQVAAGWRLVGVDARSTRRLSCHKAVGLLKETSAQESRALHFLPDPTPPWTPLHLTMCVGIGGFVLLASGAWLYLAAPHLPRVLAACFLAAPALVVLNQWRCILIGPGYAAENKTCEPIWTNRCDRCSWAKPRDAHHCSVCRRCVLKMDHHCWWLGGCVGQHNYCYFLLTEGWGVMASSTIGLSSLWRATALAREISRNLGGLDRHALGAMAGGFALGSVLLTVCALVLRCVVLHVKLLSEGGTAVEHMYGPSGDDARTQEEDAREPTQARARTEAPLRPVCSPRARLEEVFGEKKATSGMAAVWLALVRLHRVSPRFRWVCDSCRIY